MIYFVKLIKIIFYFFKINYLTMSKNNIPKIESLTFNIASPEDIKNRYNEDFDPDNYLKNLTSDQIQCLNKINENLRQFKSKMKPIFRVFDEDEEIKLENLHELKPLKDNYDSKKGEKYIQFIVEKCSVSKEDAIKLLKENEGNLFLIILKYHF